LQPLVAPASDQQLDREPAQQDSQHDNGFVPVGKEEVAEGGEEVLKAAHALLLTPSGRPDTAGQRHWLGAGT
jgi:hypothetical protein